MRGIELSVAEDGFAIESGKVPPVYEDHLDGSRFVNAFALPDSQNQPETEICILEREIGIGG